MTDSGGKIVGAIGGALILAALFLVAVTWNRTQVFVPRADGGLLVVFADGDCHSRMQRAAIVAETPGTIVRAHDFENHPQGTVPHTTAPMDYLIAALGTFVRPLDAAGAWISPLLGLAAVLFLWFWARAIKLRPRWPMLVLFSVSPALTHAFALGRPDHQSLLLALTTVALAANFAFIRTARSAWAWTSGAAWGFALWVSWFEPLVLLAGQEIARAIVLRRAAWPGTWRKALFLAAGIALATWAFEGFRNPWPSAGVRELFPRWSALLGELQGAGPRAMFTWTGWLLVLAPLLLAWDYFRRRDPVAPVVLILLAIVTALTGWQARWNGWQAAVFCLALPWMLAPLRKGWIVWTVFAASLWPVAWAWDARLSPSASARGKTEETAVEASLLGQVAQFLRAQPRGGVLAPWWISPALARLSGQPMVGGTSHQSLPGSADTARFFLAEDDARAAEILRRRQVRYVVSDDPDRVIPTSTQLLGVPSPAAPLIVRLARGRAIPGFLKPVFANQFFRVYKVTDE
ncbi:MAG: hypothetical protein JHD33_06545 [Chthoniobacterales bacterium]|nr:hypothetical protein [Chthoniobacterales bacterium]